MRQPAELGAVQDGRPAGRSFLSATVVPVRDRTRSRSGPSAGARPRMPSPMPVGRAVAAGRGSRSSVGDARAAVGSLRSSTSICGGASALERRTRPRLRGVVGGVARDLGRRPWRCGPGPATVEAQQPRRAGARAGAPPPRPAPGRGCGRSMRRLMRRRLPTPPRTRRVVARAVKVAIQDGRPRADRVGARPTGIGLQRPARASTRPECITTTAPFGHG